MNGTPENLIEVYRPVNVRNRPGAVLNDLDQMPGFQVVDLLVGKQPPCYVPYASFQTNLV
jgi:hypothetical protein